MIIIERDSTAQNNHKNDLKVSKLPFGYEKIYNDYNDEKLSRQQRYEFESSSELIDFYNSISANNKLISDYNFPLKNAFDFDFYRNMNLLKTDLNPYNIAIRLPDINKHKVYIANSTKNNKKEGYNLINNIDLITEDRQGNIINSINISHQYYPNANDNTRYFMGAVFKYFYIDSHYIIHIKYFDLFEEYSSEMIAYIKYKITDRGNIVWYFDKIFGYYKSELEEGEVINHLKEGVWREDSSSKQPTYYMKKYKKGFVIDNIEVVTEDKFGNKISTIIDKDTYLPLKN